MSSHCSTVCSTSGFVPLQVSSSESVASDMDLEIHSASEVVTSQLSSKDEGIPLGWMKVGWVWYWLGTFWGVGRSDIFWCGQFGNIFQWLWVRCFRKLSLYQSWQLIAVIATSANTVKDDSEFCLWQFLCFCQILSRIASATFWLCGHTWSHSSLSMQLSTRVLVL